MIYAKVISPCVVRGGFDRDPGVGGREGRKKLISPANDAHKRYRVPGIEGAKSVGDTFNYDFAN